MTVAFKKAERTRVALKIGVQGPSGSGKTLGALALAHVLAGDRRVAVVDTENGSASLYADRYDFDVLELTAPYTSQRYLEAMQAAAEAGYGALVVDSLSHQWIGAGGILSRKEAVDARGGNSFTNWAPFTKEHESFKAALLALPLHVVATLRTKQDYVLEKNDRGKEMPKKVGLAAVQREGLEYELSIMFELQMDHRAATSKDRTGLFDGELVDLCDPATGRRLLAWLASGKPLAAAPEGEQRRPPSAATSGSTGSSSGSGTAGSGNSGATRSAHSQMTGGQGAAATTAADELTLEQAKALPLMGKEGGWGGNAGKPIGDVSSSVLEPARTWFEEKARDAAARGEQPNPRRAQQIEAITLVLEERAKDQTTLPLDGAGDDDVPAEVPAAQVIAEGGMDGHDAPEPAADPVSEAAAHAKRTSGKATGKGKPRDVPVPVTIGGEGLGF